jgi:hypothetical protein
VILIINLLQREFFSINNRAPKKTIITELFRTTFNFAVKIMYLYAYVVICPAFGQVVGLDVGRRFFL